MPNLLRRTAVILAIAALLVESACAPAAAPTPTAPPAKTAAAPATAVKPAATPAAKPSPSAAKPASPSAVRTDWQAEWDKVLAAAKAEGKVTVAGAPGEMYRTAALAFREAYPDIQLDFTGVNGRDLGPKILSERSGGQYLWDLHMGGSTTMINLLKASGVLAPLRPALILPEVLDDSKWVGGFEDGWMDSAHQLVYDFEGRLTYMAYVNRDLASQSELNSIDQLIDPRWKGKIISGDQRVAGAASEHAGFLLVKKGEDWLRKLFAQEPAVMTDNRLVAEGLVRGRYPIGLGLDASNIVEFTQQGIGLNVRPLDPDGPAGATLTSGFGNLAWLDKAPHPNAAKVFINWLLSKQGQDPYVKATTLNSRRVDVQQTEYAPKPYMQYINLNKEELLENKDRAMAIAKEMIK